MRRREAITGYLFILPALVGLLVFFALPTEAAGLDVTAFTDLAKPETTFGYPMTDYGNEIADIMKGALERVMLNQGDPAEIPKSANDEVNNLF